MANFKILLFGSMLIGLVLGCEKAEEQAQTHLAVEETSYGTPTAHEPLLPQIGTELVSGQLVFVPAYSSIRISAKGDDLSASHVSIRNTSLTESLKLRFVDLYGDNGALLRNYIQEETEIPPLGSKLYVVRQAEKLGGGGSNYLVEWISNEPITPPFIESVTYRYAGTKAMAFSSPAMVLRQVDVTPSAK